MCFLLLPILSISLGLSLERQAEFNILKRRPVQGDLVPERLVPKYYWLTTSVTHPFLEVGFVYFVLFGL